MRDLGPPLKGGLIPAHTGKTPESQPRAAGPWAHPRSRGENGVFTAKPTAILGSSPLTRGKLNEPSNDVATGGLIPAHAGKTCTDICSNGLLRAHPRSRGENTYNLPNYTGDLGSSPLTRGKHRRGYRRAGRGRLIPAHAGKTTGITGFAGWSGAHPRSRGENIWPDEWHHTSKGSSPLTRGKRCAHGE